VPEKAIVWLGHAFVMPMLAPATNAGVAVPVPPLVFFSTGPASNKASIESRSVLIFVPQVSVEAPTSGFVRPRFVVVVSAMISS